VTLQLKNETPLSEISKLINDLKSELEKQQILADLNWEKTEIDCQDKLNEYSQRITKSSAEIEESEFNIKRLAEDLIDLQKVIENKNHQLKILNDKEELITDLRAQDKDDFEKKVSQISEILSAINLIISKLGNLNGNTDDLQNVLMELGEIGKSNPINSFVHFTMSFDQDTLNVVLEKLEKIQKSLETALDEEKLFEDNAESNCKVLMSEIAITKKNLQEDIKGHNAQINELEGNKRIQEGRRDQNKEELENCNKGKSQWTMQCSDFEQNYSENTNQRLFYIKEKSKFIVFFMFLGRRKSILLIRYR